MSGRLPLVSSAGHASSVASSVDHLSPSLAWAIPESAPPQHRGRVPSQVPSNFCPVRPWARSCPRQGRAHATYFGFLKPGSGTQGSPAGRAHRRPCRPQGRLLPPAGAAAGPVPAPGPLGPQCHVRGPAQAQFRAVPALRKSVDCSSTGDTPSGAPRSPPAVPVPPGPRGGPAPLAPSHGVQAWASGVAPVGRPAQGLPQVPSRLSQPRGSPRLHASPGSGRGDGPLTSSSV
ncbi:hypothetical protein NDU88_002171 [Pleurodeles waltl]|uniref:Uncharacterized protein n=1 Tax=Pleurodeles waltl TaxID=8319 RepID=A0AAV7MQV3_PLEWA|nr:hypothetical protein NDU88_002171 [Pleurodeles waltl]